MAPTQALTLASLLIEFELEQPAITPIPPGWQDELLQARKVLTELKHSISGTTQPSKALPEPKRKRIRQRYKLSYWDRVTREEQASY